MKKKKQNDDDIMICNICHIGIDPNKEYCEFIHLEKKYKVKSNGFYHVNCFRERLSGSHIQAAVGQKALEVLNKIGMGVAK